MDEWDLTYNNEALKEQLAEKDAERELDNSFWKQECDSLQKALAEKEKEIENLNNRILISQLQAPKEQILNILGSQCIQYNPDQDKISFAVEQLEKVKETTEYVLDNALKNSSINQSYYDRLLDEIDNQIKQLKEQQK